MTFQDTSDSAFEKAVSENFGRFNLDKAFYAKVAGASHSNADGVSRTRIIAECAAGDGLELRPEPENQFDPNAIAVIRQESGEQLGYVERRLAFEITKDSREYGPCWGALFRHPDYHPDTGAVVGAVIYVMRLPAEGLAAGDKGESEPVILPGRES